VAANANLEQELAIPRDQPAHDKYDPCIEAAPAEERGTIVTVRLPLASVQRQQDPVAAAAQPVAI
jgi:hypothetical protein